jgi:uncharacterized membrane protein YuzA (DUF378 family)
MADKIGGETFDFVATLIVAVAAINWGTVEFFDTNILTDTAGLSGDTLTIVYGVIAVLGVVVAYNYYAWYEDM